jgi:YihY family inner membrane protein
MSARPGPRETVVLLVDAARSEGLGFLAAALAYYAFVSLIPLVILAVAVATFVGGDILAITVTAGLADLLTAETLALLENALESGAGRRGATVVGLLFLGWSGLRLFRGLHVAFARIYGTTDSTSVRNEFGDAVATLGAVAAAAFVLAVVMAVLGSGAIPGGRLVAPVFSALLLPVAFYPVYYILPDVPVAPVDAVPGAVLAGLGWTLLGWAFSLYTTYAASVSIYGAVGVVLLVLTWFYAGALLVLLGAVLNAVWAGQGDNRQLQQDADIGPI